MEKWKCGWEEIHKQRIEAGLVVPEGDRAGKIYLRRRAGEWIRGFS